MRYIVSHRFYDVANRLVEVALQSENEVEYDLAFDFLRDLVTDDGC